MPTNLSSYISTYTKEQNSLVKKLSKIESANTVLSDYSDDSVIKESFFKMQLEQEAIIERLSQTNLFLTCLNLMKKEEESKEEEESKTEKSNNFALNEVIKSSSPEEEDSKLDTSSLEVEIDIQLENKIKEDIIAILEVKNTIAKKDYLFKKLDVYSQDSIEKVLQKYNHFLWGQKEDLTWILKKKYIKKGKKLGSYTSIFPKTDIVPVDYPLIDYISYGFYLFYPKPCSCIDIINFYYKNTLSSQEIEELSMTLKKYATNNAYKKYLKWKERGYYIYDISKTEEIS